MWWSNSWQVVVLAAGWLAGWWLLWRVPRLDRPEPAGSGGPDPDHLDDRSGPPSVEVAVVIPARDEEHRLPHLLASLAAQDVTPREIVVVDDRSTDATAAVASSTPGVRLVAGTEPPPGWTGKPWACHQGVGATEAATIVLLDADVTLAPGALRALVAEHARRGGLLSVAPHHVTRRAYEQLSAPFNLISVMGVGMAVPGRDGRAEAAFGPCVVTSRADLATVGGYEAVHDQVIEDVALGRAYCGAGLPVHALGGGDLVAYRMYPEGVGQLLEGWSKNMAAGAGATPPARLALVAVWVTAVLSSVGVAVTGVTIGGLAALGAVAVWALMAVQQLVLSRRVGDFHWLTAALYPVVMAGFVAVFARSAWVSLVRRNVTWRDRQIPVGPGAARARRRAADEREVALR